MANRKNVMRRRTGGRYAPFIRAGARFIGNVAGNYLRNRAVNYMMGRNRPRQTDGVGVTDQYDRKTIYRKKRMPRRMRKRWRRKKRSFDAMLIKRLGTKTIMFNDTLTAKWTGGGQRNVVQHLYGKNGLERSNVDGNLEVGNRDVFDIVNNDPLANEQVEKAVFESAVLDFTCANNGATTLEVDVYEFYSGSLKNHVTPNWGTDQGQAQSLVEQPSGAAGNLDLDDRGASPFEFPLMSRYGWKILKKTKYLLSPGKSFTYQYRDPRNRWIKGTDVFRSANGTDMVFKGATRSFLFLAKAQVGQPADAQNLFNVGATRVYRYKIMQNNRIQSAEYI